MGEIELTGAGAAAALDRALVGRPSAIGVGRARYSMLCDEEGGILDDLVVYRLSEERFLIVANASNVHTFFAKLRERTCGFDTDLRDTDFRWRWLATAVGLLIGAGRQKQQQCQEP